MKGQGNAGLLYYLIVLQVVFFLLFTSFAFSMSGINCPNLSDQPQPSSGWSFNGSGNLTAPNVTQTNYLAWINILTGSCSGLPYWVWFIVFLPAILVIIIVILPNWLAGG